MTDGSNDISQVPSVYTRGAQDGIFMGLYMIVIFLMAAYQIYVPLLNVIFLALALGVPFIAYFMMRRDFLKIPQMRFFSAVWMHGISIFLFGSLILSIGVFVFLKWIEPYYFSNLIDQAIASARMLSTPDTEQLAEQLTKVKNSGLMPGAGEFAFDIIWSVVFSGSILTMFLTWILRLRYKKLLQK